MITRYRIHNRWFGAPMMVLQIQVNAEIATNMGNSVDVRTVPMWRDATVEDFQHWNLDNIQMVKP